MWRALELARRGKPYVAPNPMCGAVIVKDGKVVSEACHEAFGEPHAEANALRLAGAAARGATMYVTLEPCCETYEGKKTPPCLPGIIDSGLKRVVVAVEDPHQNVRGKGLKLLHEAGIQVELGVCKDEAREINAAYFSHVERGRPLVTAKWAMTLDGKIATRTGDARWITSEQSRAEVHFDRGCTGAIIVGIGTVLIDDPELTARGEIGRQPVRVVIDTDLKLPAESKLVQTADQGPVFVYAADDSDPERQAKLEDLGIYLILMPRHAKTHLRWMEICNDLGERGVNSALVEGGGSVVASAFQERAIDRVKIFVAPKVFGGEDAKSPVEGPGVPDVSRAVTFTKLSTRNLGPDIVIEGTVVYPADDGPSPSGYWTGYGGAGETKPR